MELHVNTAEIFVPDGLAEAEALARTTHMAIGAHQDDLEIMACSSIIDCYQREDLWYMGVVVTNGSGSPRSDLYADYSDDQMQVVRRKEQKKAAIVGEFSAQALLDYPSGAVKDGKNKQPVEDLARLLAAARPEVVITHNLADKHDTHIGVALKTIEAIRSLPADQRPKQLLGAEVWRDLDWMNDNDKVILDCSKHENLQAALLGVFDSQIAGGKRYDLATMGRRKAHATYFASHGVDECAALNFAMDMSPLITDIGKCPLEFVQEHIARFATEVDARVRKMMGK
ncbi:MAG: PIG-L family deacetylase [Candidatus Hydrogenedentes bacterium]|nr:PIG-L family deacetylase [Candidatus Hydrogenedentota bacterium]